jgi:hypothetical protein
MCARATYKLTWEEIVALYRLTLGQPAVQTPLIGLQCAAGIAWEFEHECTRLCVA